MKPTNHLRFVGRDKILNFDPVRNAANIAKVNVLQQWWAYDPDSYTEWVTKTNGEWRDVATEKEDV